VYKPFNVGIEESIVHKIVTLDTREGERSVRVLEVLDEVWVLKQF
jgi:hypothetical protein